MLAHPTLDQLNALGLHGLAKGFKDLEHKPEARGLDPARLEAVSARALELGVLNCKGVAALLARKANETDAGKEPPAPLFEHANLRGPGYYH